MNPAFGTGATKANIDAVTLDGMLHGQSELRVWTSVIPKLPILILLTLQFGIMFSQTLQGLSSGNKLHDFLSAG